MDRSRLDDSSSPYRNNTLVAAPALQSFHTVDLWRVARRNLDSKLPAENSSSTERGNSSLSDASMTIFGGAFAKGSLGERLETVRKLEEAAPSSLYGRIV